MKNKLIKLAEYLYKNLVIKLPYGYSLWPQTATFELLYQCNLKCKMCYLRLEEVQKKLKPKKILTTAQIKKIIDKIPKLTSISFTGGEPLLRKDIFEILEHSRQRHRTGLISNLVLADNNKIKKLLSLKLGALMFSLDGDKDCHEKIRGKGSYEATFKNAELLVKLRNERKLKSPQITLNIVIQPGNIGSLAQVAKTALQIGVDKCNFQLFDPSLDRSGYDLQSSLKYLKKDLLEEIPKINEKKLLNQLKKVKKLLKNKIKLTFTPNLTLKDIIKYYQQKVDFRKSFCFHPYYSFRISPFGEVYPCFNLYLGDLVKESFWDIWNGTKFLKFRQEIQQGKYLSACIGCCHWQLKK